MGIQELIQNLVTSKKLSVEEVIELLEKLNRLPLHKIKNLIYYGKLSGAASGLDETYPTSARFTWNDLFTIDQAANEENISRSDFIRRSVFHEIKRRRKVTG